MTNIINNRVCEGVMFMVILLSLTVRAQIPDIVYTLKEEMNPGVFIGNIAIDSGVGQDVAVEEFPYLEYNFLNPNKPEIKSLFSINRLTGAMYSTRMVDREEMCNRSVECYVAFDVTIQSSATTFLRLLSVRVEIQDVNDNAPTFQNSSITVNILESVIIGTNFRINGATDEDMSSENTVQFYDLVQPNSTFGVKVIKKFDGSTDVSLSVLEYLDRETQDVHSILILAKDNGSPQRTGTILVNVNVLDANDNVPRFTKNVYNVSASENTTTGTIVETLEALDKDSGENANVTYRFSPLRTNKLEQLLTLNELSGELTVRSALQYESGKSYEAIVEARDNGNPPQLSQSILIVNIVDVGNNPPRLQLNLVTAVNSETIFLSEGSKVGTFVGHIKVEDRDPADNGVVTCECQEGHFGLQKLDGKGYALLISKQLDRETNPKHNVTVTCKDGGSPNLSSSIRFVVVVTDENDNGPQFLQNEYLMNITENVGIGTTVGSVLALDRDLGENAQFYYTLDLAKGAMFQIDSDTGIIVTNSNIDRETVAEVTFVVNAIDSQNTRLTGKASVRVKVIDVNDNDPYFLPESLKIKAIENLTPGTKLAKLAANDADEDKNGKLSYAAVEHNPLIPFIVYEDGTIRLESSLNRELKAMYEFYVIVQDKGDIPRTTTGRVVIIVVDANDHRPVIEFPNSHNDTVTIDASLTVGSGVADILAYDEDAGDNGDLEYSIVYGNDNGLFQISPKTGEIILVSDITTEDIRFHQLKISVRDQGAVPLEDTQFLNIEIVQSNSALPPNNGMNSGHVYLIITGVVAGVTLMVAIIIVTVIIRMKRNDNNYNSNHSNNSQKGDHDFENVLSSTALPNTSLNSNDSHLEFHPVKNSENDIIFTSQNTNPDSSEGRKRVSFIFSQINGKSGSNDNKSNFSEESTGSDSGKGCSDDENATFSLSETVPSMVWQPDIADIVPPVPPKMPAKPIRYQAYHNSSRFPTNRSHLPHAQFLDTFSRKPLQKENSFTEPHKPKFIYPNIKQNKSPSQKDIMTIQNSLYSQTKCFKDNLRHYPGQVELSSLSYNSLCQSSVCSIDDDQYSTTSGSYTINSDIEDVSCAY